MLVSHDRAFIDNVTNRTIEISLGTVSYTHLGVPLDFEHFRQRALDFNSEDLSKEDFLKMLTERLATTDINAVRNDVLPFIKNPSELDIWSNDYFVQLVGMMKFQEGKIPS